MAPVDTDRNLLFGLLALQNGLIDQGQLVAAFQAWTRDKAGRWPTTSSTAATSTPTSAAVIEAMAGLHVKKHGGDVEKSLAAVRRTARLARAWPHLGEPDIEATLARVARARTARPPTPTTTTPTAPAAIPSARPPPTDSGSASCGPTPGAAWGPSSWRSTASCTARWRSKQILEKHADDPVSRQRFVAEAEITGGLEHPGVVPVYGLGTDADGRPYYAMRFIKGDSLKEAIERFHDGRGAARPTPAAGRWSCASCCGGSPTSATPSTTPTPAG